MISFHFFGCFEHVVVALLPKRCLFDFAYQVRRWQTEPAGEIEDHFQTGLPPSLFEKADVSTVKAGGLGKLLSNLLFKDQTSHVIIFHAGALIAAG